MELRHFCMRYVVYKTGPVMKEGTRQKGNEHEALPTADRAAGAGAAGLRRTCRRPTTRGPRTSVLPRPRPRRPTTRGPRTGALPRQRAWQMLLATSYGAIQLKTRGFKVRCMTWRTISSRPYPAPAPAPTPAPDPARALADRGLVPPARLADPLGVLEPAADRPVPGRSTMPCTTARVCR